MDKQHTPVDAVTIPAACGAFHLPSGANTPRPNWHRVPDIQCQNNSLPSAEIMQNVGANPVAMQVGIKFPST